MLCGHAPFYGQSASTEEIMQRIRGGQFSFEGSEWSSVSQAAKSVIEGEAAMLLAYCNTYTQLTTVCMTVHTVSIPDATVKNPICCLL